MYQVLIVDDEESVREGIAFTVPWNELDVDYVYQAASGYEALELLRQNSIDIVITDIRMPGMSGLELIQTIQNSWKGTKCIILSGHAEFHYAQEAIRLQTTDYLLKPVLTGEVVQTIRNVQQKLKQEWEQVSSFKQTMATLNENRPLLRSSLLGDLLHGDSKSWERLQEKIKFLDIPFTEGNECALMIIRLEDEFPDYDTNSQYLLEYAVCNITEEIYGKYFKLWNVKDKHDFLVFVIRFDSGNEVGGAMSELSSELGKQSLLERLAEQLQRNINTYLSGRISLMISRWGRFPDDMRLLYEQSISAMRKRIGNDKDFFFTMRDEPQDEKVYSLDQPYSTPTLMHLLEAGKWIAAEEKLKLIFDELGIKFSNSIEHIMEAYHVISSTFSYVAHQNGRSLVNLLNHEFKAGGRNEDFHSLSKLQNWSFRVLGLLKEDVSSFTVNTRKTILAQVREFAESHLEEDVSLGAIAEYVHLHPVYLSKVFKLETGTTLSEYLNQLRMNKAAYLLKQTSLKIYEIAKQVGYENTYFMKVFKKHYNITPQEYREGKEDNKNQ